MREHRISGIMQRHCILPDMEQPRGARSRSRVGRDSRDMGRRRDSEDVAAQRASRASVLLPRQRPERNRSSHRAGRNHLSRRNQEDRVAGQGRSPTFFRSRKTRNAGRSRRRDLFRRTFAAVDADDLFHSRRRDLTISQKPHTFRPGANLTRPCVVSTIPVWRDQDPTGGISP